ncbi:MAG: S8 family serine peptidase [Clostridiales bacterium]|nr:S8 family serine peptidase [Clostridiales bacterium]
MKNPKKITALLVSASIVVGLFATSVFADTKSDTLVFDKENFTIAEDHEYVQDHILVITDSVTDGITLSHDDSIEYVSQIFTGEDYTAYKAYLSEGYDVESTICALNKEDYVLYAEPDYCEVIDMGGSGFDYENPAQWHHDAIHTFEAWNQLDVIPGTPKKVRVAVIDGTFNIQDPEIYGSVNMSLSADFSTGSKKGINWTAPKNAHSNHCAALIAGTPNNNNNICGVASGSKNNRVDLVCLSIINQSDDDLLTKPLSNTSVLSGMAAAIVYASENGCKVTSMSVGTTYSAYSKTLEAAVETAYKNGMLLVVASGNEGTKNVHMPASFSKVVSVANLCVGSDGKMKKASSSCYGKIDLSAPGCQILSSNASNGTCLMTGTSMSTPITAGVIALVMSVNSNITPFDAYDIVKRTATDIEATGYDTNTGYGCVNAYEAVKEAVKKYYPSYLLNTDVSNTELPIVNDNSGVDRNEILTLLINTYTNVDIPQLTSSEISDLSSKNASLAKYFNNVFTSSVFWKKASTLSDKEFVKLIYSIAIGKTPNKYALQSHVSTLKSMTRVKFIGYLLKGSTFQSEFSTIYSTLQKGDFKDSQWIWNKKSY